MKTDGKERCRICPHGCMLAEGEIGFCRARSRIDGKITALNYGMITSLALDPIEKKPLFHFFPGSRILSVGSFGCNLRCGFCQNHGISMAGSGEVPAVRMLPEDLADRALELVSRGNIGAAYTYNEPLIGFEYVADSVRAIRAVGLKNVLVTNGYVCEEPLKELLPFIDAMNIDLKGFTESFYRNVKGGLETVKHSIRIAREYCHVEVTTLMIPGENDSEEEMAAIADWLAGVDSGIPLHISRFFPGYHYSDRPPADIEKIYKLADIARRRLKYVYTGNC